MQLMTANLSQTHDRQSRRRAMGVMIVAVLLGLGLTACGDDDDDAATIPLSEWVAEFDALCVEMIETTAQMTQAEFEEVSNQALVEMRAMPAPEENAATAAELLDIIEGSTDANVDEADIESLDMRAGEILEELDVSEECIGGPQG